MATIKTEIKLSSNNFFSDRLNVKTASNTVVAGDDRLFSVERTPMAVRASANITMVETALANLNGKEVILTDPQDNSHTIKFSNTHSSSTGGSEAKGVITVTNATVSDWNNKTLILVDNSDSPVTTTITFSSSVSGAKVANNFPKITIDEADSPFTTRSAKIGVAGLTTTADLAARIVFGINSLYINKVANLSATQGVTNTSQIKIQQINPGNAGNTTIAGTFASSTALGAFTTQFAGGGDKSTSYIAGLVGNAATKYAHLLSLQTAIGLANAEGLINMKVLTPAVSTSDKITVAFTGYYTTDSDISINGSAVRLGEMTVSNFTGAAVPSRIPTGKMTAKFNKASVYMKNLSRSNTVYVYYKDFDSKAKATLAAATSTDSTTANATGRTIILKSSTNETYTLTSVTATAAAAQDSLRTGNNTASFVIAESMEETLENINDSLKSLDNTAVREKEPFVLQILTDKKQAEVIQKDKEGGTKSNTVAISGTFIDISGISATAFTGGTDTYSLVACLDPLDHMLLPSAGAPSYYFDAEGGITEVEVVFIEKD